MNRESLIVLCLCMLYHGTLIGTADTNTS